MFDGQVANTRIGIARDQVGRYLGNALVGTGEDAAVDGHAGERRDEGLGNRLDGDRPVEPVGGGLVQSSATYACSTIPPACQQSYANTLLDRWAAARGAGGPVSVQIVDRDGEVLLERTRP